MYHLIVRCTMIYTIKGQGGYNRIMTTTGSTTMVVIIITTEYEIMNDMFDTEIIYTSMK